ncbi:DeoR/GlpR family DNA-binding transcription regulator [Spelaeicoccus albus]|uniref:Lactose phosphotransferase system repressor n=1 Tax=Spelaeicoccus albus TaxID=1280376 RepID=A0A7Z0AC67_9MICO|nr:DeoR/GlpR family DNA-binding transcription regulator [Spelaeicoccus albus]NYI67003.1 DeoR/GlpR family transcriptional regulator of sugar metabolism [Spelaeicoccus albus]
MLQADREAEIVRAVRRSGPVSVDDLSQLLGVSASTVRRDLNRLNGEGTLERIRGGARISDDADNLHPFSSVAVTDKVEKLDVARRAASLVEDGAIVLLDIGTTTASLAEQLRGRRLTVITASLAVYEILRNEAGIELILLGGVVRRSYQSMVGQLTTSALGQVRADITFLGTSGVRANGDVLDSTPSEVPVKCSLMRAAERSVLVADEHKFPGSGAFKVCSLSDVGTLVSNADIPRQTRQYCDEHGVEVL